MAAVAAEGVDVTVPGSPPFHRLPLFDPHRFQIGSFLKADNSQRSFPGADSYYDSIISLPTFTFAHDLPLVNAYVEAFQKVIDNLEELNR